MNLITIILLCIAYCSYAIMYTLQFHYFSSIFKYLNPQFWYPALSWVNKYKNKDDRSPRFFGSTTIFVFITDAFHLFQFVFLNSFTLAFAINWKNYPWYVSFLILKVIYGIVWKLTFEGFFIKKKK